MLWSVWQLQMEKQQQEPVSLVGISHCKFVIIDKVAWLGRFKTEQIDMHQSICAMVNTIYHKGCVLQFQKTRFKTRNTTYWNVQIHVPSLPTSWRKIYFAGIPVTLFKSRQPLPINVFFCPVVSIVFCCGGLSLVGEHVGVSRVTCYFFGNTIVRIVWNLWLLF